MAKIKSVKDKKEKVEEKEVKITINQAVNEIGEPIVKEDYGSRRK